MDNLKTYKGKIGRLEFLKTLFACCFVNWILSVIITILSSISPIFMILYIFSLYVILLLVFCYKKRGLDVFQNEIISWFIAVYAGLFSACYGLWQLAACVFSNLFEAKRISALPYFVQNESIANVSVFFGYISLPLTIILLVYLLVPGRKIKND